MTTAGLRELRDRLALLDPDVDEAERIDQIRLLEELKSAAAAAQTRVAADFRTSHERRQRAQGVPERHLGRGIAHQVALAKRESPARARRFLGWAAILVTELPQTFAALQSGWITEWRAQTVARETAWLSLEHRRAVDEEVGPLLEGWGDRRVEAEVKKRAYRLDPHGFLSRLSAAERDRRVTLRPAPDCMSHLNACLPVAQGVSVIAALRREADSLCSQGDDRTRDQIMADTLVERVTGQSTADAVPARVELLMTDQAFFNTGSGSDEPAHLLGCGTVPAELARRLVRVADEKAAVWVRRLYADPTGRLVAMESSSRCFDGALGEFLVIRDQICRTPWCGAPIRHGDHVITADDGGPTAEINGQGLCAACNQAKEAPGWRAGPAPPGGAGVAVEIFTPTGHQYLSHPPDPPRGAGTPATPGRRPGLRGPRPATRHREDHRGAGETSPGERLVMDLVWAAA